MRDQITDDWKLRQTGIDYNNRLSPAFYKSVNENERMYAGDQWHGVQANGLSTPVFNIFKRIINYFIAAITSQKTDIQYTSEELDESGQQLDPAIEELADILTAYTGKLWEDSKMDTKIRQILLDCALSGDGCIYVPWNESFDTGQKKGIDPETKKPVPILGEIDNEVIDNVNVYFGNPNDKRVNENGKPIQPYILVEFREMTSKVKELAKKYDVPQDQIDLITGDVEYEYQSGDRGAIELDVNSNGEGSKTTMLLKMWPKDGTIHAKLLTKHVEVRKEWDTKRKLYPLAWMNWDSRKNSYHGQALGTGLCDNQRYINKQFAVAMIALLKAANPKVVYDKTRIGGWSNGVEAIGVEGDITNVVDVIQGAGLPANISEFIDKTIQYTKDLVGANDSALGDVDPEQASGRSIIATQQQASIPLELIKGNLYQFIEDLGYIWMDTMITYYGTRTVSVEVLGKRIIKEIDFSKLSDLRMKLKVDVGPSSYWSQITSVQTLDNLLDRDRINLIQYLERLPAGFLAKKQELIEELKEQQEMEAQIMQQEELKQKQFEEMATFIESLPPDVQAQIQALPEGEMEQTVMQMMQQSQAPM